MLLYFFSGSILSEITKKRQYKNIEFEREYNNAFKISLKVNKMNELIKIGIVVMFKMDSGGGAQRVVVDLIKSLNSFGCKVYFLTPWKLNHEKIEEIFEPINIEKEYNLDKAKIKFCVEVNLSRKLMKNKFKEMAENVDLIIDIDGGVLHDYLPKNKKYVIWRISGIESKKSEWEESNWKMKIKYFIKKIITPNRRTLSKKHNIYAVDAWTRKGLIEDWDFNPRELCLYPEIKIDKFSSNEFKKNQAIIFGRISPNKRINESIEVFAKGAKETDYKLVIIGGVTPDSENYIKYLKKVARDNKVEDKIEFIKNPDFERLKKIVEESKILIECQRDISLTMTSIECLAAGVIVLVHKNGGTFLEVLDSGKYGFGFDSIEEGARKLRRIIEVLEDGRLNPEIFVKRAEFFSGRKFRERLKKILEENL